jgi:hypothetical protein
MAKHPVTAAPMRLLLVFATGIATSLIGGTLDASAQSAYDYPICSVSQARSGARSCYYSNYEQCMATMSGIGGYCTTNPAYRGPVAAAPPRRKVRRH